ncbi:hypothetical protein Ancab_034129 [Ancistrocladus abbreviatus]
MEAMRKAKSAENLFVEELRRMREIEQELAKQNKELENMKNQLDMVLEELRIATNQKSSLESRDEMTMYDEMDLLVQQVKMLARDIAFSMSTLKCLLEQSVNDPDALKT